MNQYELKIYQRLRRIKHFDPLLYGVIFVVVAFMSACLAWLGVVLFMSI